jgi:uncharacterized protein YndB with AHSA1/START domain
MAATMTVETGTDSIRVEMVLKAPLEKVWWALTTPEGWSGWFSEEVEGDFSVGGRLRLMFDGYGTVDAEVTERDEAKVFAYRWFPGDGEPDEQHHPDERTTVRFEISALEAGTRLVMTETGFERLPEGRRLRALAGNSGGWKSELAELEVLLEEGFRQGRSTDRIVRERFYPAPLARVWQALATTEGLCGWFCKRASGDFMVGEIVVLTFDFGHEIEGPMKIVEYEPMTRLAWRWHPGQTDGCKWEDFPESEATLVAFELREVADGTEVKLLETGFERIPESRKLRVLELNSEGWTEVLEMVAAYLAKG